MTSYLLWLTSNSYQPLSCKLMKPRLKLSALLMLFGYILVFMTYHSDVISIQIISKDTAASYRFKTPNSVSQLDKQELKINFKPQITDKYIIFLCDESRDCGGWGDRQRGIVTIFLLSLVWKRRFGIKLTTPCDLRASYRPTEDYNWVISDEEIKGKSVKILDHMGVDEPLINTNYNASGVADVLFIKTNCYHFMSIVQKYAKFLPRYLMGMGRAGVFREIWNRIVVPTTRIKTQFDKILGTGIVDPGAKEAEKELVCAHIRIGRSEFLPFDHVALALTSVPTIWNFFEQYKNSRIFIATDHGGVRKDAINRYRDRFIGSYATLMNPDNMRFNTTLACIGQETAYVDQLILAQCDVLVYYGPSGFSIHATYLKKTWKDVFSFTGSTINPVGLS